MNIAVFSSHNGSDLQAIIDACNNGKIDAKVCAVFSNNADSKALTRAQEAGICNYYVSTKIYDSDEILDDKIVDILDTHSIDIVFLAGYLKKIGIKTLRKYHNRIFNIHPALLPKYGGKGMYGMNVHTAVINAKEAVSGITVHRVNEEYDKGEIVAQIKIDISKNDTADSLATKILQREHTFIVEIMNDIIDNKIQLG